MATNVLVFITPPEKVRDQDSVSVAVQRLFRTPHENIASGSAGKTDIRHAPRIIRFLARLGGGADRPSFAPVS
jgi:hypothetical protein